MWECGAHRATWELWIRKNHWNWPAFGLRTKWVRESPGGRGSGWTCTTIFIFRAFAVASFTLNSHNFGNLQSWFFTFLIFHPLLKYFPTTHYWPVHPLWPCMAGSFLICQWLQEDVKSSRVLTRLPDLEVSSCLTSVQSSALVYIAGAAAGSPQLLLVNDQPRQTAATSSKQSHWFSFSATPRKRIQTK